MIKMISITSVNKSLFLILATILFSVSSSMHCAGKKKAPQHSNSGQSVSFFSSPVTWVQNTWRSHPGLCSLTVAGALGVALYQDKVVQLGALMKNPENRPFVLTGSLCALTLLYVKHEAVADCIFGPEEDNEIDFDESYDEFDDYDDYGSEGDQKQQDATESIIEKMARSGVRVYQPGEINTRFCDVAGLETVKEDLQDIMQFLKHPAKFKKMGAKIPKGVLLSGSPGNGKTLIARALAGEVQCPFLYITGSEFIESLVGVGAARVRDLFEIARSHSPCIIFIDEIDTIGHKRSAMNFGGASEETQALNQILAEMDGFEQSENPIIVIGATNRLDVLDEALTRPGRFDRKIMVHNPLVLDRCKILEIYLKKVRTASDVDAYKIALGTTGFSGAELANLINEAAILAVRENAPAVTMSHIDQARDYLWLGRETKGIDLSRDEQWKTAVHEAGHTLCAVYQPEAKPLYKVTIVPRSKALGLTWYQSAKESYNESEVQMRAAIVACLGGSVAEELIFGHRETGIVGDLQQARSIATSMVMRYGMSEEFKDVSFQEFEHAQHSLPDEIATKLHYAVAKIIRECRQEAEMILMKNKQNLLKLAQSLMDEGTIMAEDVYRMCGVQQPEILRQLSS